MSGPVYLPVRFQSIQDIVFLVRIFFPLQSRLTRKHVRLAAGAKKARGGTLSYS